MKNPCHNCTDRHRCCWSDCEKYKAFRTQIDSYNADRNKGRDADGFRADYIKKSKQRANTR